MVPNSLGRWAVEWKNQSDEQNRAGRLASGDKVPLLWFGWLIGFKRCGAVLIQVGLHGKAEGEQVNLARQIFYAGLCQLSLAAVVGWHFRCTIRKQLAMLKTDYGITCALVPASHEGVIIIYHAGRLARHLWDGTVDGKDVFIPLDYIIGGVENAGRGWRMLMSAPGVGRGISLPALSTSASEMTYLSVGAFAKSAKKKYQSVSLKASRMPPPYGSKHLYARSVSSFGHLWPVWIKVVRHRSWRVAKYGKRNWDHAQRHQWWYGCRWWPRGTMSTQLWQHLYQAIPVFITVEGANILTRSLMIFGQGAMRCHPYLFDELQLLQSDDKESAVQSLSLILNI